MKIWQFERNGVVNDDFLPFLSKKCVSGYDAGYGSAQLLRFLLERIEGDSGYPVKIFFKTKLELAVWDLRKKLKNGFIAVLFLFSSASSSFSSAAASATAFSVFFCTASFFSPFFFFF